MQVKSPPMVGLASTTKHMQKTTTFEMRHWQKGSVQVWESELKGVSIFNGDGTVLLATQYIFTCVFLVSSPYRKGGSSCLCRNT